MKILLIDNYDSFTYNLYQYIGSFVGINVDIKRNDEITLEEINNSNSDKIVISPGPGKPEDALLSLKVIQAFKGVIPILGVCLGHQAIAISFGGKVDKSINPVHGKTISIIHDGKTLYKNLPQTIEVMRYHSLEVDKNSLPECLEITSYSLDGKIIMGLRHRDYNIEGVQFHPESILTKFGYDMIANWIHL